MPYGFIDKYIKSTVTVKPADKHLETVSLDTDDYTDLCLQYLTDTNFTRLPPICPIISHMNSLLSASATCMLLDFLLKPFAQLYLDYLHNSTSLILTLHNLVLPSDLQLITVDVVSLYHSIPQSECIDIIHQELCSHSDNLLFANYMTSVPSHILQLFMFSTVCFQ